MNNITYYSIDLETLDTIPSAAVVSVGIVPFYLGDTPRLLSPSFYGKLPFSVAAKTGTVSQSTLMWWLDEGQADARAEIYQRDSFAFRNEHDLIDKIGEFFNMSCPEVSLRRVVGNGATFDCAILADLFRRNGREVPWNFWNERDLRTMVDLPEMLLTEGPGRARPDTPHCALDDAEAQATTYVELVKWLREISAQGIAPNETA